MRRSLWLWLPLLFAVAGLLAFRLWPHESLDPNAKADSILVDKSARTLSLLEKGQVIASYRVALGRQPVGHKVREGDGRTPEGRYFISTRNANSGFYRALQISYPNTEDEQNARRLGAPAGSLIMIHGIRNGLG